MSYIHTNGTAAGDAVDDDGASEVSTVNGAVFEAVSHDRVITNHTENSSHANYIWDYGDFDAEYMNYGMEIDKDYVLDYSHYRKVLEDCNRTISETKYPDDGELNFRQ